MHIALEHVQSDWVNLAYVDPSELFSKIRDGAKKQGRQRTRKKSGGNAELDVDIKET